MRIFGYPDNIQKIEKTYLRQSRSVDQKRDTSDSTKVKKTDEIIISPKAAEMQKYVELTRSFPEIREDKAKSINEQIGSENYNVNGKSVAKSIVDLIG